MRQIKVKTLKGFVIFVRNVPIKTSRLIFEGQVCLALPSSSKTRLCQHWVNFNVRKIETNPAAKIIRILKRLNSAIQQSSLMVSHWYTFDAYLGLTAILRLTILEVKQFFSVTQPINTHFFLSLNLSNKQYKLHKKIR